MTLGMRPAFIAVLTAIGVLATTPAARADITPILEGRVLTVTGTDDAETMTKSVGLRGGQAAKVSIRLRRSTHRTILARADVRSVDAAGNRAAGSVRLRLRLPPSAG